jgi:cell division septum initiation protein DivIVA
VKLYIDDNDRLLQRIENIEEENDAFRTEIKDAGMKGLSVPLEAYSRYLQDVKAVITALQQDKEKLLKIIADLESLSHHAMREANRGGAGYDINEELKEARTAIDTIRKSKDDTRQNT